MIKYILSLDVAKKTGWTLFKRENEKLELIDFGVLSVGLLEKVDNSNMWDVGNELKTKFGNLMGKFYNLEYPVTIVLIEEAISIPSTYQKLAILRALSVQRIAMILHSSIMDVLGLVSQKYKKDLIIYRITPMQWMNKIFIEYNKIDKKDKKKRIKEIVEENFKKDFKRIDKVLASKGKQDILDSYLMVISFYENELAKNKKINKNIIISSDNLL